MSTSGMTRCNPSAAVGNQGLGTRLPMDRKSNANGSTLCCFSRAGSGYETNTAFRAEGSIPVIGDRSALLQTIIPFQMSTVHYIDKDDDISYFSIFCDALDQR